MSGTERHTDVLRVLLNKSFEENDEASTLNSKSSTQLYGSHSSMKMGHQRSTSRNVNIQRSSSQPTRAHPKRCSNQSERHPKPYTRPTGPELVRPHIPTCSSSLPQNWSSTHDRFIAYLATHAPLTENGKIPAQEEFHSTVEIVKLVRERFPRLCGYRLRADVIEMRLALLDQAGNNDYFDIRYGAYNSEEWGRGI